MVSCCYLVSARFKNECSRTCTLEAGGRDEYVGLALVHSWTVMAEVFVAVCRYLKVNIAEVERELRDMWSRLQP
jgi:hypothetical protein